MKKLLLISLITLIVTAGCEITVPVVDMQKPTAYIDEISPAEASPGAVVSFMGHGTDPGSAIVAYRWSSNLDGELSSRQSFDTSSLSQGAHTIHFKVQNERGAWSDEITSMVSISSEITAIGPSGEPDTPGPSGTPPTFPSPSPFPGPSPPTSGQSSSSPPPSPAADLIIEDILVSHTVANRIDFIYTIKNQGGVSAGSSKTVLTIDGNQLGFIADDVEPLAAGESRQEWFPEFDYTCTGGLDTLTVKADAYNTVWESNEENNEHSEAFYCWSLLMKADLVVTDIMLSGGTISYTLKNQGNYVAGAGSSFLYIDNVFRDAHSHSPLNPGESSTESFSYEFICLPGSTHQVKVHVNPTGYGEESNYDNNERSESFVCLIMRKLD